MPEPKPERRKAPGRTRADAPRADDAEARTHARVYVSMPVELHRRLAMWCRWTGTTPSEVMRLHAEDLVRGFVVQQRSGSPSQPAGPAAGPIRVVGPDPDPEAREAG